MTMDIARPSRKKQIRRRRILYGLAGAAGLILITFFVFSLEPAVREVERSSVWIGTVERGEMLRKVRGAGTLVPEEIRWIAAETTGQVERIEIKPGAQVSPETIILELSNPEVEQAAQNAELRLLAVEAAYQDLRLRLENQLLDQQANLARVEAEYESAKLEAEAQKRLFEDRVSSEIQWRKADLAAGQLTIRFEIEQQRLLKTGESHGAQLAANRAEVAQQRALYRLRADQLDSLRVRAGISGVLQQVPVEEGQRVTLGDNLARVARPDKLKAEVRINETQAKDVQIGQVAEIDTRNGKIPGRVTRIDPAVQQGTVTVDVALVGELPKGARPDLSVDGMIELERLADVLYLQRPAYGQADSTIGLFRIDPDTNRACLTQVQLGRTSVNEVELLGGLEQGNQVILSDSSQWDDADCIRLVG
ncbi:MAG: HlyD family efflux transporter periplasmic adaptor subunit [Thermoanaerobaculia bacterium]